MSIVNMPIEFPFYNPRRDAKWQEIQYRYFPSGDDRITNYCAAISSIYVNGYSDFVAFEATNRDDFFSAYQFDHSSICIPVEGLLKHAGTVFPFFKDTLLPYGSTEDVEITHEGRCQFESILENILLGGGAYETWKGSVDDAKALASEAVSAICTVAPGRPWSAYLVDGPWCSYFYGVAWDYTLVVQFPYDARWFVLAATDTD